MAERIDLFDSQSTEAKNCNNLEAAKFPGVESLIKKFDGLSGRKLANPASPLVAKPASPLVANQCGPLGSAAVTGAVSLKATSPTERTSTEGSSAKDCNSSSSSDASVFCDLHNSRKETAKEADLIYLKSPTVSKEQDELLTGSMKAGQQETGVSKTVSATAEARLDCLDAAICTADEAAPEEDLTSPFVYCDENNKRAMCATKVSPGKDGDDKADPIWDNNWEVKWKAEPKSMTHTVSGEEAVELEEPGLKQAKARDDDSEKSNEQVAPDACADSTGDGADTDLFVEAVEVLEEEAALAKQEPEVIVDMPILASASASGSESESSAGSAASGVAEASASSEEARVLHQKISVRVVSGQLKQPKKPRHQRGCQLSGVLASAASDSMTVVSHKKQRLLLSNCARTLKNKVLDASRTMMSLVSLHTDEFGTASSSRSRSKHHRASASAPISESPSSAVSSPVAASTGTVGTLKSPPVLTSEEEPLLPIDSAEHQDNNSALSAALTAASRGLIGSNHSPARNPLFAATTTLQRERLQPATLILQVKNATSAARMSFSFVTKRRGATAVAASCSRPSRISIHHLETAAFFACGELNADVSLEVDGNPTAAIINVPARSMFSRLVRRYEMN